MKKRTNFLPGISPKFYGRNKRSQLEALRLERKRVIEFSITDLGALFSEILPIDWLESITSDARKRLFPQTVTFWAWASQLLEGNQSCSKALTLVQKWYSNKNVQPPKFDTSAYCKARKRLPEKLLKAILAKIKAYTEARVDEHHLWYGHRLKAIDGTSVKLMDTAENQAIYPQPSMQKQGCGFPVMGIVGVLDLAQGTICDYITCKERQHDSRGLYQLCNSFSANDVVIADRAFCSYELIGKLKSLQVDSVMRLHQQREAKLDWRKGKKLDRNSRIIEWKKSQYRKSSVLSKEEWEALPAVMKVRIVRVKSSTRDGKKQTMYLATTLLDDQQYPTEEIALLYLERWKIEVKFRDIKTTMNLEKLMVKTPEMAHLTMQMVQIVYNLLKAKQTEAIREEAIQLDQISFKATLDLINENRSRYTDLGNRPKKLAEENEILNERIRERLLNIRPDRQEPRAIKTRAKPYQLLTKPRHEFIEIQHKSHYRKAA